MPPTSFFLSWVYCFECLTKLFEYYRGHVFKLCVVLFLLTRGRERLETKPPLALRTSRKLSAFTVKEESFREVLRVRGDFVSNLCRPRVKRERERKSKSKSTREREEEREKAKERDSKRPFLLFNHNDLLQRVNERDSLHPQQFNAHNMTRVSNPHHDQILGSNLNCHQVPDSILDRCCNGRKFTACSNSHRSHSHPFTFEFTTVSN